MSDARFVLVTGSSRGIGLEFARQYCRLGWRVLATCRRPDASPGLAALADEFPDRLLPLRMDVADEEQVRACRQAVAERIDRLDLLINNAGCFAEGEEGLARVEGGRMLHVFAVNAVGPVIVAREFAPLLARGAQPKVVNITSGAGVLSARPLRAGGQYSYGGSKAALNHFVRGLAGDLRDLGVIVVGIGPGFVLTDMTRDSGRTPPLTPPESVAGMIRTIDALTMERTGLFFGHDGKECDWMR